MLKGNVHGDIDIDCIKKGHKYRRRMISEKGEGEKDLVCKKCGLLRPRVLFLICSSDEVGKLITAHRENKEHCENKEIILPRSRNVFRVRPGDLVWVKESFKEDNDKTVYKVHAACRLGGSNAVKDQMAIERALPEEQIWSVKQTPGKFRAARYMMRARSRFLLSVVNVDVNFVTYKVKEVDYGKIPDLSQGLPAV